MNTVARELGPLKVYDGLMWNRCHRFWPPRSVRRCPALAVYEAWAQVFEPPLQALVVQSLCQAAARMGASGRGQPPPGEPPPGLIAALAPLGRVPDLDGPQRYRLMVRTVGVFLARYEFERTRCQPCRFGSVELEAVAWVLAGEWVPSEGLALLVATDEEFRSQPVSSVAASSLPRGADSGVVSASAGEVPSSDPWPPILIESVQRLADQGVFEGVEAQAWRQGDVIWVQAKRLADQMMNHPAWPIRARRVQRRTVYQALLARGLLIRNGRRPLWSVWIRGSAAQPVLATVVKMKGERIWSSDQGPVSFVGEVVPTRDRQC